MDIRKVEREEEVVVEEVVIEEVDLKIVKRFYLSLIGATLSELPLETLVTSLHSRSYFLELLA